MLLTSDGDVRLCDFGLACSVEELKGGTPEYMAPEQLAAYEAKQGKKELVKQLDGRVDVYAVALIYFEMACGERAQSKSGALSPDHAASLSRCSDVKMRDLTKFALVCNVSERPTAANLLEQIEHPRVILLNPSPGSQGLAISIPNQARRVAGLSPIELREANHQKQAIAI